MSGQGVLREPGAPGIPLFSGRQSGRQMVIICLLISLLLPGPHASGQTHPLTLEAAINLALRQNHALVRDALGINVAVLGVADAERTFALQVRPQVDIGLVGEEQLSTYALAVERRFAWGTSVEARVERTRGESLDATPVDFSRVSLGLRQPLFRNAGTLVNTAPLSRADSDWRRTRRLHELRKGDLVIAVVRAYHEVFRLERQVRADEQALLRTEAHHRLARARESAGRATRVDALRAELQIGQARSRLQANRERLIIGRHNLADLLGLPPDTSFELASSVDAPDYAMLPDVAAAVALAFTNRLDYAQVQADLLDAQREERVAQRQLLPDLTLVVGYERFTDALSPAEQDLYGEGGVFVSLQGGFDVDRTRDRNAARRAGLGAAAAVENLRIAELAVAREVQQAMLAYRTAQAEVEVATRNHALADVRQRLAQRLFAVGRSSSFEVTDAEDAFLATQSALLAARAAASVRGYELSRSLGTLIEAPPELRPDLQAARAWGTP